MHTHVNKHNAIPAIPYFYCHSFSMSSQAAQTSSPTSCLFDVPFILRRQHLNLTADVTLCRVNLTAATGPRNLLARGMSYHTPASGLIRVNLLGVGNLWTVSVNIFCLTIMASKSPKLVCGTPSKWPFHPRPLKKTCSFEKGKQHNGVTRWTPSRCEFPKMQ